MFNSFWTLLLICTGSVYLFLLEQVRQGLIQLDLKQSKALSSHPDSADEASLPRVSVIIPCRDEAEHIGAALEDLTRQDYPADLLQIIVVDDRSNDGTGEVARGFAQKFAHLIVLSLESCPAGLSPKKNALAQGLSRAEGDVIVTTDGDCRFGSGWISGLTADFSPEVGLVTGLTVFDRGKAEPLWQRLQQLDYLSHSFLAAGTISRGWALNCNGSNLAIRREVFSEAGGYSDIGQVVTGDDTLLLQRVRRGGKWRIRFSARPETRVRSWPEETPGAVLQQRLRWGSGGLSYTAAAMSFGLAAFFFFIALFLSPFFRLAGWTNLFWVIPFLLKIAQEARVMACGFKIFQLHPDWLSFLLMELIHVPAILFFSLGGHLLGFRWKGEKYRRTRR
jgi:cellulose synthase/poly-beta-1,6-N-acetylglucosamine synthase-like glycosyltransferase